MNYIDSHPKFMELLKMNICYHLGLASRLNNTFVNCVNISLFSMFSVGYDNLNGLFKAVTYFGKRFLSYPSSKTFLGTCNSFFPDRVQKGLILIFLESHPLKNYLKKVKH